MSFATFTGVPHPFTDDRYGLAEKVASWNEVAAALDAIAVLDPSLKPNAKNQIVLKMLALAHYESIHGDSPSGRNTARGQVLASLSALEKGAGKPLATIRNRGLERDPYAPITPKLSIVKK